MRSFQCSAAVMFLATIAAAPSFAAPIDEKTNAPRGLSLVPGDAIAFLHVDVDALGEAPLFQLLRKPPDKGVDPVVWDFAREQIGVPMQEIDGFTWMVLQRGGLYVVTTKKPFDQKRVLKSVFGDNRTPLEFKYKDRTLYFLPYDFNDPRLNKKNPSPKPWDESVYFPDKQTIVVGTAISIAAQWERQGRAAKPTALTKVINEVAAVRHHLHVGIQVPTELRADLNREALRQMRRNPLVGGALYNFKPLLRMESAYVTADLGQQTKARIRIRFPNEALAKDAELSCRFALLALRGATEGFGGQIERVTGLTLAPSTDSKAAQLWLNLVNGIKAAQFKRTGRIVTIHAQAETKRIDVVAALKEAVPAFQRATLRNANLNNLKQMALALVDFAGDHKGRLPLANWRGDPMTPTKAGVGLSWRVAVLPYVGRADLYRKFKLDEPWDSEHNKKLIKEMPMVFAVPTVKTKEAGLTHYRVFTSKTNAALQAQTPFTDLRSWTLTQITNTDGTAQTLSIVEAAEPVIWTSPNELVFDANKPLPKLGALFKDGFHAAWCDGSARFLRNTIPHKVLRVLITVDDRQPVPNLDPYK